MDRDRDSKLLDGETVLWRGQPENKIFTVLDIFLIPFSLMWGGFAIFWEITILTSGPSFFVIWGVPFVLFGLYFIFGRFLYKNYSNKNTYYYVTNKRIIILKDFRKESLSEIDLYALPTVSKSVKRNGLGTIRFGNSPGFYGMYESSGLDFLIGSSSRFNFAPTFYNIKNVDDVYRVIKEAKEQSKLN